MSFKESLISVGKAIVKKGRELGNIAKLKIEIGELEDKIQDKKIEIADNIIEREAYENNSKIKTIVEEINDLKNRIKIIEKQIKDIKTKRGI